MNKDSHNAYNITDRIRKSRNVFSFKGGKLLPNGNIKFFTILVCLACFQIGENLCIGATDSQLNSLDVRSGFGGHQQIIENVNSGFSFGKDFTLRHDNRLASNVLVPKVTANHINRNASSEAPKSTVPILAKKINKHIPSPFVVGFTFGVFLAVIIFAMMRGFSNLWLIKSMRILQSKLDEIKNK